MLEINNEIKTNASVQPCGANKERLSIMGTTLENKTTAARLEPVVQRLLHCPFCGASGHWAKPANVRHGDDDHEDYSEVFCMKCNAKGPQAEEIDLAIDAWNYRRWYTDEVARAAIRMFLEYRDQHGCDDKMAATKAIYEIIEVVEAETDI